MSLGISTLMKHNNSDTSSNACLRTSHVIIETEIYRRLVNQKSRFLTSTGSLLPVSFLGVFPLRGVFAEAGVFGLNENKMSISRTKITPAYTTALGTYIGGIAT